MNHLKEMRVNIDFGTQITVLSLANISVDITSNMRLWSNHLSHLDTVVFWGGFGGDGREGRRWGSKCLPPG